MMYRTLIVFMLFAIFGHAHAQPLGLDWKKTNQIHPEMKEYTYYLGSVQWGLVVYISKEDVLRLETELQLFFSERRTLQRAIMVLGPSGLHSGNCFQKVKQVEDSLNSKYGEFAKTTIYVDTDARDLFYTNQCALVRNGLYSLKREWSIEGYRIVMSFFGEEGMYYIEIEYISDSYKKRTTDKRRF